MKYRTAPKATQAPGAIHAQGGVQLEGRLLSIGNCSKRLSKTRARILSAIFASNGRASFSDVLCRAFGFCGDYGPADFESLVNRLWANMSYLRNDISDLQARRDCNCGGGSLSIETLEGSGYRVDTAGGGFSLDGRYYEAGTLTSYTAPKYG